MGTIMTKRFPRSIPSTKHLLGHEYELKTAEGDEQGMLKCVFSVFDKPDRAGDIVRRSALSDHDGKEVPLVWSHDWDRIIGKGVLEVQDDRAIWKGSFFLDTSDGMEAYKTVKNLGSLQQYSWGFRILEYNIIEDEDSESWWPPLEILKTEVYEVSPVLVGQNQYTGTLALKSQQQTAFPYMTHDSSYPPNWTYIVPNLNYMNVTTTTTSAPVAEPIDEGKRLSEEIEDVHAAASALLERVASLAETRAEEGRKIGAENLDRLRQHSEQLREVVHQLDALIAEQTPPKMVPMKLIDDRAKTNERRRRLLQMGIDEHE